MDDDVPLVVSEVNPDALEHHRGIIANPNCSTMQMVVALKPLYDGAGIERLVICTYQAVSGTNRRAVDELLEQSHALLHDREIAPPEQYAHQIAFNALPHAGKFAPGDDHTDEERKMMNETRKILGDPRIAVSATCVRVPVLTGHSEAVNVQTREPLSPETARELLRDAPGVTVVDDPDAALYPLAIDAAGKDDVFVGRIRRDPGHERALDIWIVSDNLRKGAATTGPMKILLHHLLFTSGSLYDASKASGFSSVEFLDTDCTAGSSSFLKRVLRRFFLRLYRWNLGFWNKVTCSAYHEPSPQIFSYEIKALARV